MPLRRMFEAKAGLDPEQIPPLVLAYIGDAVYELYVRSALVARRITKVNRLHQEAVKLVRASSQARFLNLIEEQLTEEEVRVMKRGRNANSGSPPKGAEVTEYRRSTGLESLIGYLYVKGDHERLEEILTQVIGPGTED